MARTHRDELKCEFELSRIACDIPVRMMRYGAKVHGLAIQQQGQPGWAPLAGEEGHFTRHQNIEDAEPRWYLRDVAG